MRLNTKGSHRMQVLSLDQAAFRAGIVRRTLERLLAVGEGPAVIQVSKRRVGIAESDLESWLLKRRRPAPGEVA
jgi:predicted DNA-binding transcriptional regulator AlpA